MNIHDFDRSWSDEHPEEPLWQAALKGVVAVLAICAAVYMGLVAVDLHMDALERSYKHPIELRR